MNKSNGNQIYGLIQCQTNYNYIGITHITIKVI